MKTYKNTNKIYKKNRNVQQSCAIFFERSTRTRRIRRTGKCGGKKINRSSKIVPLFPRVHVFSITRLRVSRKNQKEKISKGKFRGNPMINPGKSNRARVDPSNVFLATMARNIFEYRFELSEYQDCG